MYNLEKFINGLIEKNPGEKEFIQAAKEVLASIIPYINEHPEMQEHRVLERLIEPDRIIQFKVEWEDDKGYPQVNRGYRVQFNNLLGPYKGGLRFHPSVSLDSLKFLGFEQTFKNSLTGLPMGGGKGGSDFNPKGKSPNEILRFCRSFMSELFKYIGPNEDVPAGDLGVGQKEVGYLYGQYRRLKGSLQGTLTGKATSYGGSLLRPESTGFGALYFAKEVLKENRDSLKGKTIALSGFGNVAWGAATKAMQLGAKVITVSGPDGYILDESGINTFEKLNFLLELRNSNNDVVEPYAKRFGAKFIKGKKPWEVKVDIAMPCAIQNELNLDDAKKLLENKVQYVFEVSNMGCTLDAANLLNEKIIYAPGKTMNAGGVACSALEMTQNATKLSWTKNEVDQQLQQIMQRIHDSCVIEGRDESGKVDYVKGANIAGFKKVASALMAQGY